MTQLEFINELIENVKSYISIGELSIKAYKELGCDEEVKRETNNLHYLHERLTLLNQIKADLEVWYVVEPNLRFEKHSRAWIYLDRISKDHPSYRIIEKELLKNNIRSTTVVIKERNKITVKRQEVKENE